MFFTARRRWLEWALLGISVVCIGELLYAPHLGQLKDWGAFPALTLPGMTTSVAELAVMGFIVAGALLVAQRVAKSGSVDLGPRWMNVLVAMLIVALLFSLAMGIALGNREFGRHVRAELFSPVLFVVVLNLGLDEALEVRMWRLLLAGSAVVLGGLLLLYLLPGLVGVVTVPEPAFGRWYALSATLFAAAVALARLMFRGFSPGWAVVAVAALVTVTLHLSAKPVVFGLLVVMLVIVTLGLATGRRTIMMRGVVSVAAVPLLVAGGLALAPSSVQLELGRTLAERFLKQTDVSDVDDLKIALDVATSGAGEDITEGRFDIWRTYLDEARAGLGFAPSGFGHAPRMRHEGRSAVGFPPHNLAVYYGYHGGLISTFAILGLIAWFALTGFWFLAWRVPSVFHGLADYQLIGGYAFLLGVTAISFVTTTAHANDLRVGWFFWMVAAVMVRRLRYAAAEAA